MKHQFLPLEDGHNNKNLRAHQGGSQVYRYNLITGGELAIPIKYELGKNYNTPESHISYY